MPSSPLLKPHKKYSELVSILEDRGMIIPDKDRAERKLSQVGYYRLSGFWYTCRKSINKNDKFIKLDEFQDNISFNEIFELYLFDKKLRLLMLDAIERIEIHIRSVIAHEMGAYNEIAYKDVNFINPRQVMTFTNKKGQSRNKWNEWSENQRKQIDRSREKSILWHTSKNREIPFWVAIEAWDFGITSKYYEMLKSTYKNCICYRLGINNVKTLGTWLHEINILRNRCAHHARIWNQETMNPSLKPLKFNEYFDNLNLDKNALKRLYGMISIVWFLVKKIGPNSQWINKVATVINSKPPIDACPYTSMGFPDNSGFPVQKFTELVSQH